MPFPDAVRALVERFHEQKADLKGAGYNETQLRREFLDPFFTALGWDVDNRGGQTEAYKDVIHEARVRLRAGDEAGATKAPDYAFRVGGVRRFFVEAKKPSIYIQGSHTAAFQVRRYAWSDPDVRVAILTDFEEFAVYNGRIRPDKGDGPDKHRLHYLTYDQYEAHWDWLEGLFSRDAVVGGSLDALAKAAKTKRGVETPGDAFLKELDAWREALAVDLAQKNPALDARSLNAAVQALLDRLVFLRIAEDRGIEPYGELKEAAKGQRVYPRLVELFREADRRYNSGLFHFAEERGRAGQPDTLAPALVVSDRVLKPLIGGLYYPESPYAFDVLPTDLLGQVYERFLGKTIRLDGRRAVVEEKPEVKKAGGVYYTPTYVVDYIVGRTLGPLFEGRTPATAAPLAVVDPACGSGSFLLGAYDFLLGWYLAAYTADDPGKHARGRPPRLVQTPGGDWRLSLEEKKRILRAHLYGVDIDPQAVEVTKLSLLLRLLEGETAQTLDPQLSLLRERILPELADNVKSGNSLVGPDFYDGQPLGLFSNEDHHRVNAFDWATEFAAVMGRGGFDAVIGNPPYVLLQSLNDSVGEAYLKATYTSAAYKIDTYHLFVEKALALTRPEGLVSYITPNTYLTNKYARDLRRLLLDQSRVLRLTLLDYNVFKDASVDTVITLLQRYAVRSADGHTVLIERSPEPGVYNEAHPVVQSQWERNEGLHFGTSSGAGGAAVLQKMEGVSIPLGDLANAYFGIQTHGRATFVSTTKEGEGWHPALDGSNVRRYELDPPTEWVSMNPGAVKSGGNRLVHEQARIGVRQIGQWPVATLLPASWYSLNTIYNVYFTAETRYSLHFVLGVMLSSSGRWYWVNRFYDQKRIFPKVKKEALLSIPVPRINFDDPADVARHDRLVALVTEMLDFHRQRPAADGHARTLLDRRIAAADRQIDGLVYTLYGLTPDEIALVEAAAP